MHLIHKLRRSISHRPRHIFDLPDEILCLILEYCCQDLDFLLWSCPLVTLPDQFCHDCFHCTLCHGSVPRMFSDPRQQRGPRSGSMRSKSSSSSNINRGSNGKRISNTQNDDISSEVKARGSGLRKRRSRCHESRVSRESSGHAQIFAGRGSHSEGIPRLSLRSDGPTADSLQGSQPCPRNGNRPWCHHMQQPHLMRKPLLWRIVAAFSPSLPPMSSLSYMQPPAKVAFDSFWQHIEGLSSYLTTSRNFNPYPGPQGAEEPSQPLNSVGLESAQSMPLSSSRRSRESNGRSSAFSASQGSSLHRRRAMSLSAHATESSSVISPMGRAQSSIASTKGRSDGLPEQENDWDVSDTLSSDGTDNDSEDEEDKDDFDDSIHLSGPFRNLLVSRRFADAAVQALWRDIVFHGHDMYQMQSLLSTLCKEDRLDFDARWFSLRNVNEADEEQEEEEEGDVSGHEECQTGENLDPAPQVPTTSSERTSPWTTEHQESSRGWIESLNSSLKRFSGLHRLPEGQSSNTRQVKATAPNGSRTDVYNGQRRHTMAGLHIADNGFQALSNRHGKDFPGSAVKVHGRSNESRWPYRRYVRRAVLNFAHPQASSHMFIKVLECISKRCPDQIQALDLHANEKMQDAGLGKTSELERLFGSGFTKLRYLRLQGGFVDNQLLYAIIKGCTTSNSSAPLYSDEDRPNRAGELPTYVRSPSLSASVPLPSVVPCRLSHVFLGPGSVTDSAVERLIAAAGHSLEVFTVTSCVDVGGSALASLLTKCPKLRVLGVHRSLARDRDLLEGLGIEVEGLNPYQQQQQQQHQEQHPFHGVGLFNGSILNSSPLEPLDMNSTQRAPPPRLVRKKIIAPLERLELGTVKMTTVGVAEILKGTGQTLRFLVLETQHFNEEFLTDVILPHCQRLEGLYFDDPECLQRQQRQLQGLGFSAGRRGPFLPNWLFKFGRSGRTFYSDPHRHYQPQPFQAQSQAQQPPSFFGHPSSFHGADGMERHPSGRSTSPPKVSAWLGETTTDEWVTYGDCALWSTAASPGISFESGGANASSTSTGGAAGGLFMNNQYQRRQAQPLHHAYHNQTFMATLAPSYLMRSASSASGNEFHDPLNHGATHHPFMDEYDTVLERYRVTRETIENALKTLTHLRGFTLMQMDFIVESQGLSEWKTLMRQEVIWVESAGFRALQLFYLFLFLGYIYFGMFGW